MNNYIGIECTNKIYTYLQCIDEQIYVGTFTRTHSTEKVLIPILFNPKIRFNFLGYKKILPKFRQNIFFRHPIFNLILSFSAAAIQI